MASIGPALVPILSSAFHAPAVRSFDMQDELTSTVLSALNSLPQVSKANLLLDTALALIEAGKYGPEVENYIEVYLKTPNLGNLDLARALVARGNARKAAGDKLLVKANLDFHAALQHDPSNREVYQHFKRKTQIHHQKEPACQRTPIEIWDRIASYIPRYHLRSWLSVSGFYHEIAARHIFHTLDICFNEDPDNLHRGLDIFDRAKDDPVFASRVKCIRLHWAYDEDEMMHLVLRIFRYALPAFKSLEEFEWIGYPEMKADMVKVVLASHPRLHSLGLIGFHFDAVGVSGFNNLRKFTLRAEDDDGDGDMGELRTVLDKNEATLRHLVLGAYLERQHSWDSLFQSPTIKNLTHLDLVDTRISHIVLARIAYAHQLQSLTLHGTFEEPGPASVVFSADQIVDGQHSFLPHLEAFRCVLVGNADHPNLYQSLTMCLRNRKKLRRLDLGSCPWDLIQPILPGLVNLRVLGVTIAQLNAQEVASLVSIIPQQMVAINLSAQATQRPLHEYASLFSKFGSLSFLHLQCPELRRPQPNLLPEKEFQVQTDLWLSSARCVGHAIPSLDFLGWHGEHFVIARSAGDSAHAAKAELKELPGKRRLDCAKGVDLGSEDAAWLERKDVPVDYETPTAF